MENQVQKQSIHYCAFISYRHVSPDQEIAARLHRLIERYTVPKALRGPEDSGILEYRNYGCGW